MPYIKPEDRPEIKLAASDLADLCSNSGELNYAITVFLQTYLKEKGLRYENINSVIGVLECAKLELYRRVAAPYENIKVKENGDVGIFLDVD